MLGLAMKAEYFGGPLTWWFSPLGLILLLSLCDPNKMDKATIYIAMDFYSTWALVISKNEIYS